MHRHCWLQEQVCARSEQGTGQFTGTVGGINLVVVVVTKGAVVVVTKGAVVVVTKGVVIAKS